MMRFLYLPLVCICLFLSNGEVFSAAYYPPDHQFPTAYQSQNACYFTSINIALEAKYTTKLRLKKVLDIMGFDGKTLATWEYKKRFSNITHIQIQEYSRKKDLVNLLNAGEPVLVSTEIPLSSKRVVRHVSVAYSYDMLGIWVSDPLGGKRKRISWNAVFNQNNTVKYNNLRTIRVKSYDDWTMQSKNQEKKEDIWINETLLKKH